MWLLYAKISYESMETRHERPQEMGVTMCPGNSLNNNAYTRKEFKERSRFPLARIPAPGEARESLFLFLLLPLALE